MSGISVSAREGRHSCRCDAITRPGTLQVPGFAVFGRCKRKAPSREGAVRETGLRSCVCARFTEAQPARRVRFSRAPLRFQPITIIAQMAMAVVECQLEFVPARMADT